MGAYRRNLVESGRSLASGSVGTGRREQVHHENTADYEGHACERSGVQLLPLNDPCDHGDQNDANPGPDSISDTSGNGAQSEGHTVESAYIPCGHNQRRDRAREAFGLFQKRGGDDLTNDRNYEEHVIHVLGLAACQI